MAAVVPRGLIGRRAEWREMATREGMISVEKNQLYVREIGQGETIVVLHGGPDFDQSYLLPEMDRLGQDFRLVYYDQRGRGKSAADVQPDDVSIDSDIEDVERVREYLQQEQITLLGHSWGGLLAMEYALRYPARLSHLILMNSAFASAADLALYRQERLKNTPADMEELKRRASTPEFQAGDPDSVANYYRVHFRSTVRQPQQLESIIARLRTASTQEGILKARAIEDRLALQTWLSNGYDLLPKLRMLKVPTLVLHGDYDFVPVACARHIAEAIPAARLVVLQETGHFSYLESPEEVQKEILNFMRG
jgi:proline iminopeptidase